MSLPSGPGVYLAMVGDRFYYGMSNNVRSRVKNHQKQLAAGTHPNKRFQRSYDKYGIASFHLVAEAPISVCQKLEACYIAHYVRHKKCMNMCVPKGDGGWFHSEETKRKIGDYWRGRSRGQEFSRKLSEANKGRSPSQYCIEMSRQKNKGRKVDPAHLEMLRQMRIGGTISEENKAKMIAAHNRECYLITPGGAVLVFDSAKDASEATGHQYKRLSAYLGGKEPWPSGRGRRSTMAGWCGGYLSQPLAVA